MRAVLDTNVAVSAAISPKGPPAHIIAAWRAHSFIRITSPALLAELAATMRSPRIKRYLSMTADDLEQFLADAARIATVVVPDERLDVITSDPADNRLLEAAVAGSADYIVSGDQALLELGEYEGARTVTPARFVAVLAEASP